MFNNELVLKSITRRVFPDLGSFSSDGAAKLGLWDVVLNVADGVAWLTVSHGRDLLFNIKVCGNRVEATYALPAVLERADGEMEYGTAWANSRRWSVAGLEDVPGISVNISEFFENIDEFLEEEAKVYKVLEGSD